MSAFDNWPLSPRQKVRRRNFDFIKTHLHLTDGEILDLMRANGMYPRGYATWCACERIANVRSGKSSS